MNCNSRQNIQLIPLITLMLIVTMVSHSIARMREDDNDGKHENKPQGVLVLDGSSVHNVGELQMHFINWGEWGSRPGTAQPYSLAPSAQWPAGSGVEYLFSAGIWVGAIRAGIPAVSTATFENEFRPGRGAVDKVYTAREGQEHGNRPPSPSADDDGDGSVDEDRLDGYDNDLDGLIDEDFAAISRQMFTCRYYDNLPVSVEIYPNHNPLNLMISQESYQWDADAYDDFIAIEYEITNIGDDVLEDVFVGFFVDGDAGPRDRSNYWKDDMVAFQPLGATCTDEGPVVLSDVAYTYDADGDNGLTPGRFGMTVLDHPVDDPWGFVAPSEVRISSFRWFSGTQAFQLGGDPTNDFERYELLADRRIDEDSTLPRDYRMMISTGPFRELAPDSTIKLQFAFVMGENVDALVENTTSAQLIYDGAWFDVDNDPTTGVEGRETPVYGPILAVWADSCRKNVNAFDKGCDIERRDPPGGPFSGPIRHLEEGDVVWQNADCVRECYLKGVCGYIEEDSLRFRSGSGGRESVVRWVIGTPPPPPNMRIDPTTADGVAIYWDNFSEVVPDNKTQRLDFEGYRVWRAADWTRPLGTSVKTGPPTELWGVLFQVDLDNGLGDDTGIEQLVYEPLLNTLSRPRRRELINAVREFYIAHPDGDPPCPQGVNESQCDTLKALALYELGWTGGRRYYHYVDSDVHEGAPYFYAVVAFDHGFHGQSITEGLIGDPASNFQFVEPRSAAQPASTYDEGRVYVVPNPATRESMEAWRLGPTNEDPSGEKIEFRNLPRSRGTVRIFTLAGDLVEVIDFNGSAGDGTVTWDLISRNGQSVASGVYLYAINLEDSRFERIVGKFVVIR